jgi:hypothetical protein
MAAKRGRSTARRGVTLAVALAMFGACGSTDEPKRPTPFIDTAPPRTAEVLPTVAPTTTSTAVPAPVETTLPATTAVTTPASIPTVESVEGLTAADIEAAFVAALATHDELQRQLFSPTTDRAKLAQVLTPEYTQTYADFYEENRKENVRFVKGSIDRRAAVALEPRNGYLILIVCYENNIAEYQTQGTATEVDDQLVQEDLEQVSFTVEMVKEDSKWLQRSSVTGKDPRCASFFSR